MSKKKKTTQKVNPTRSKIADSPNAKAAPNTDFSDQRQAEDSMLFDAINFKYVLIGIVLMAIGYFLMAGGHMSAPDEWDSSTIYSARRILIAPIFILAGLVMQFFAIFKK